MSAFTILQNLYVRAFVMSLLAIGQSDAQSLIAPQPVVVAQSDYAGQNGNPGGATSGYPLIQTFTPTARGTLFSISAGFFAPQTGLVPYYTFQFRDTVAGGLPSSDVVASVNVSTGPLSDPVWNWIDITGDFSSFGINLLAGHTYALSIDQPGPFGQTTFNNFFWGLTGSGYSGGKTYFFPFDGTPPREYAPGEDFLFTVRAVPEPISLLPALMVWGFLWKHCRRLRR
jgi:hypothetical protein